MEGPPLTHTDDPAEDLVRAMARVRECRSPSFSPDGRLVAFVSDLSGVPQAWWVGADGGWPEAITALDDPVTDLRWSPAGDWIAFSMAPKGGMNQRIGLVRANGTGLRFLDEGGSVNNWLNPWSHDGRFLTVSSNRRTPEALDCFAVDPVSGRWSLVAKNPGAGDITDLSPDGTRALVVRSEHRSEANLVMMDLAEGKERLLTPHTGPARIPDARFMPDGQTVSYLSNIDRESVALLRVRVTDEEAPHRAEVIAEREDAELQAFDLALDGSGAALVWNRAGRSELEWLSLANDCRRTAGPDLPADVVWGLTLSRDGRSVAFALTGAAAPWDVWVWDIPGHTLRQLTRSPHPGVRLEELIRPEAVRFPAEDGLELSGWLYRPRAARAPFPYVLSFHGGPEAQERPWFSDLYQALLGGGIGIFAPNVRGSAGFGKSFENLDNGPLRFHAVRDIGACVRYVCEQGGADATRLGIMGGSYGGFMTMAGLTEFPDAFAAGADFFGIVNFETFFAHCEPWMAEISSVKYGDPRTQADLLRALSPIHRLDRVKAPVLVLHGANDTNVPVVEAEQVVDGLRSRGLPVEFLLFQDEGHGFLKTDNKIRAAVATVEWFVRHLAPRRAEPLTSTV